jgi:hypothetical protein
MSRAVLQPSASLSRRQSSRAFHLIVNRIRYSQEKEHNRLISSIRVVIEQVISGVKRCHSVKDVFRNTAHGYADTVIELACGLHNFRSYRRLHAY